MIPLVVSGHLPAEGTAFGPLVRFLFDRGALIMGVIVALALAQQLVYLVVRRIARVVVKEAGPDRPEVKKRADTISSLLKSVANVALVGLGILFVLEIAGIDIGPLLAGAGIVGVALGFGAQSLVKDLLGGIFILAEHQVAVGDVVAVAGVTGAVERITVRSLTLRDFEGRVHYVPNGEIRLVTNLSQGAARFLVDVPIPAGADAAAALGALGQAARDFAADPAHRSRLLEPPEVLGFESLGAGQNVVRLTVRALRSDMPLARALRARCVAALAAVGIAAGATTSAALIETQPESTQPDSTPAEPK